MTCIKDKSNAFLSLKARPPIELNVCGFFFLNTAFVQFLTSVLLSHLDLFCSLFFLWLLLWHKPLPSPPPSPVRLLHLLIACSYEKPKTTIVMQQTAVSKPLPLVSLFHPAPCEALCDK